MFRPARHVAAAPPTPTWIGQAKARTAAALTALTLGLLAGPALAADAPAACPAQPTRVVRSTGATTDYLGTVPGIPELCRMRRADGLADFYFGVWRSDWPGAGQAYPIIRAVVLGGPGTRASFVTRSVPGLQFTDTFVNEGADPITVDGVRYLTFKVAHEREGIEGNTYHSVITSWRDPATGLVLKVVERQIAGQSYGPDTTWSATRVERLP